MPSVELKEEEQTALEYAQKYFDGNLSKFLRVTVKEYDNSHRAQRTVLILQTLAFLSLSFSLFILAISFVASLVIVLLPAIFILCSVFLFIYIWVQFKERKKEMRVI